MADKNSKPQNPQLESVRNVLIERRADLLARRRSKREKVQLLLDQLSEVQREMKDIDQRLSLMDQFLRLEFPSEPLESASDGADNESWQGLPLVDAVQRAIMESGHYLTDSQIRAVLREHGIDSESTTILSRDLEKAIADGAPLLKVSQRHYAPSDWADQARGSAPRSRKPAEENDPSERQTMPRLPLPDDV